MAVAEGSAQSPGSFFLFDRCSVGGIQKIGLLSHLGARKKDLQTREINWRTSI